MTRRGGVAAGRKAAAPAVSPVVNLPATARGRCYLFHGLGGDPASFSGAAPYNSLISGLVADDWQVFTVGELYDGASQASQSEADFDSDPGHGSRFRERVITLHRDTANWVEWNYGLPATGRDLLIGVSWGGLMVELIAQSGLGLRGFACHLPATNPAVMTEFSGDDLSGLHPASPHVANTGPGRISWGTSDTRVGFVDTQNLASALNALNSQIVGVAYAVDHTTTTGHVNDLLAWAAAIP